MDLLKKTVTLEKAANDFGLSWENAQQILHQVISECDEIAEHIDTTNQHGSSRALLQEEVGDLIHAALSLCVFCELDLKETISRTLAKFESRLNAVKAITQERGLNNLDGLGFDDMMDIWDKAKAATKNPKD